MFYGLWEEMLGISKKQKLLGVVTHPHLVSRKTLVVKYVTYRESQQSEGKNNNKAVIYVDSYLYLRIVEGRRGRDCMVVVNPTTCTVSAYHH